MLLLIWLAILPNILAYCPKDTLALYELHFETFWDRRDFPKHYPEMRPPASWSKVVGYSHNDTFKIFRRNEVASPAIKRFAETANSNYLDLQIQGSPGIFDKFITKPISRGVGDAKVRFTTDSNNSKVSMVSKIIPSPDWFVGIDSYELCRHNKWMEYIHITVEPLDAGTDKGLTFTSPNWPTEPQSVIKVITSHNPSHPAGSFYYPELESLPDLASVTITKIDEYHKKEKFDGADHSNLYTDFAVQLNEIKHLKESNQMKERKKLKKEVLDRYKNQIDYVSHGNSLPIVDKKEEKEANEDISVNHINHFEKTFSTTQKPYRQITEPGLIKPKVTNAPQNISTKPQVKRVPKRLRPQHRMRLPRKRIPTGDAMAVIDDILKNYQKEHKRKLRKQRRDQRRRRREHHKRIRPPRDCRVSEWSEWSSCSKTCGIGEQTRKRKVTKRARRGGKVCPSLQETTWCGSARACPKKYFNWTF